MVRRAERHTERRPGAFRRALLPRRRRLLHGRRGHLPGRGWQASYADWKAQAAKGIGGTAEGSDIHIVVSGDMATAAHYTKGTVEQADGQMVETNARETSIFRKEDGQWRMIGHHADIVPPWAQKFE